MKVWKKFWVMAGALSGWGGVKRVELLPFDKNPDDSKTAPARASRGEKKRRWPPPGGAPLRVLRYATLP
jgi:hypothetical protein